MGRAQMTRSGGNQAAPPFNQSTRQTILPVTDFGSVYSAGSIATYQLPQVGLLANLYIGVNAVLNLSESTNAVPNLTGPFPDPYGIIQRIRVYTNEGNEIVNLSGTGLYLANRILRTAYDPRNPLTTIANTNTQALLFNLPSGPIDGNTNVSFMLQVPIALGDQLQAGLILLQNSYTRVSVEITFGNALTNLVSSWTEGTQPTLSSISVPLYMEIYSLPEQAASNPPLKQIAITREDIMPVSNTGVFTYLPQLAYRYYDMITQFENVVSSVNTRMTPQQFSQLQLIWSQTQQSYNYSPQTFLFRVRKMLGGLDLPDGVFWWMLGESNGFPEIPAARDTIDTAQLTDLRLQYTINSDVVLSSAIIRCITRALAPVG